MTDRKEILVLALLLLVTVAVRLPGVFNRAIWYDESITLLETAGHAVPVWAHRPTPASTQKELLVGHPSLGEIADGLRETDVHPPVYYGLLSWWRRLAGPSLEAARLFSVLCSTGSVLLLYLLLRTAGIGRPWMPSLIWSLTSGAVHYGHEARNYSLAQFFILLATFAAYLIVCSPETKRLSIWALSVTIGLSIGLALQTNYLSIFPLSALFVWALIWAPRRRMVPIGAALLISGIVFLPGLSTFISQLGARPHQFQKAIGFFHEIWKILVANYAMIWNPVISNSIIQSAFISSLLLLSVISVGCVAGSWATIDKRILTLVVAIAAAPSLGLFALDLAFSKNLGKSSYVLFATPALVILLTVAASRWPGHQRGETDAAVRRLARAARWLIPLFIGLQLTGINFHLERTPGFAGSTLRELAARIRSSGENPVVVVGAGHGRGDPASVVYELAPEIAVCVVDNDTDLVQLSSDLSQFEVIWFVFAKGRMTSGVEEELFASLTEGELYEVAFSSRRLARLNRSPPGS